VLTGNTAYVYGGGTYLAILNNCTLANNSALYGGGASGSALTNCIVYHNSNRTTFGEGPNYYASALIHSCTTPLPPNGQGNFTNAPLLVNRAGGDLRLQSTSPCINAGLNAHAPGDLDLDGLPRIVGATVDLGAYEFQSPTSTISYAWLQQYGLTTDGSADASDDDGDRFNNWQEWRAGTHPADAESVLRLRPPVRLGSDLAIAWQSVPGRSYVLEWSVTLPASPGFLPLSTNDAAQTGTHTTMFVHTNAANTRPGFYRVGVVSP
jgi:hypothetical protein